MIKKRIEALIGHVDDATFNAALKMTEDDIRANRINFNLKTNIEDFIMILINSIKILRKR